VWDLVGQYCGANPDPPADRNQSTATKPEPQAGDRLKKQISEKRPRSASRPYSAAMVSTAPGGSHASTPCKEAGGDGQAPALSDLRTTEDVVKTAAVVTAFAANLSGEGGTATATNPQRGGQPSTAQPVPPLQERMERTHPKATTAPDAKQDAIGPAKATTDRTTISTINVSPEDVPADKLTEPQHKEDIYRPTAAELRGGLEKMAQVENGVQLMKWIRECMPEMERFIKKLIVKVHTCIIIFVCFRQFPDMQGPIIRVYFILCRCCVFIITIRFLILPYIT